MNSDNQVFGKEGDFITSPEISQTFGEVRLKLFTLISTTHYEVFLASWYMALLQIYREV